ncbi:hypothetical protein ACPA9J_33530 [Pseudomonas aeruginosa]
MPQSIRHLIALPELRSRLLSGAGGPRPPGSLGACLRTRRPHRMARRG